MRNWNPTDWGLLLFVVACVISVIALGYVAYKT